VRRKRKVQGPCYRIGYLRCSTEEQAVSGLGLTAQRTAITAECARRGWDEPTWIIDDGFSAKSLERPGITAALADLAAGRADTLIVAKLDRLSRSLVDFAGLVEQARREGWAVLALDSPTDMSTPQGAAMAAVLAVFSELERKLIGARTADALAAKKAAGARLGRPRVLPDDVLDRIATMRASGLSLRAIATALAAEGTPTATGGLWHASTVASALRSADLDTEAREARSPAA